MSYSGFKKEKFKEEKELMKIFKIFDNKHRLAILRLLKNKGERSVGQIADHLEIPFNTASKNLLYLAQKGILGRHYDGQFVLYKISATIPKSASLIVSTII